MKLNAKKLRAQIAADIDGDVAVASDWPRRCSRCFVTCARMSQVSEGSLINTLIEYIRRAK